MNHLLTQGPKRALEILTNLNEIIDGENSHTEEEMDAAGELACITLPTILKEMDKEEVYKLLASMSTVQQISDFVFDEIHEYIKERYGADDLLKEIGK